MNQQPTIHKARITTSVLLEIYGGGTLKQHPPTLMALGTTFGRKIVFHGPRGGGSFARNLDSAHVQMKFHSFARHLLDPVPNRPQTYILTLDIRRNKSVRKDFFS